jgi:hypothetical protein
MEVTEPLFDNAYLSKFINEKKSWFTLMEVLDLICHQFFFTTNGLGWPLITLHFFHPLTLQTLVLSATAIDCTLCEYATGKKVTVMFSWDEYRGTFCHSTVIRLYYCRSHCTTHQFHMVGCFIPPPPQRCSSSRIGTPQFVLMLCSLDWRFNSSFSAPQSPPTSIRSTSISV